MYTFIVFQDQILFDSNVVSAHAFCFVYSSKIFTREYLAYFIGFFPLNMAWQSVMMDDLVHFVRLWVLLFLYHYSFTLSRDMIKENYTYQTEREHDN